MRYQRPPNTLPTIHKSATWVIIALTILVSSGCIKTHHEHSTDNARSHRATLELGQRYAAYLLDGNNKELLRLSEEPIRTQLLEHPLKETSLEWMSSDAGLGQIDHRKIDINLLLPLVTDRSRSTNPYEDMALLSYARRGDFCVMTFAYTIEDDIVIIPDRGPLTFTIAMRYMRHGESSEPDWKVIFATHAFSRADYFEWLSKHGVAYTSERRKEQDAEREEIKNDSASWFAKTNKSVERDLTDLYEWATNALAEQKNSSLQYLVNNRPATSAERSD